MQKDFVLAAIAPHVSLQPRDAVRDIDPHAGRATDEDARPTAEVSGELLQHVRDVRTTVLGVPAVSFGDAGR